MSSTVNLSELKINLLTREQFDALATKESNEIYMVIDQNEGFSLVAYSGSYNDLTDTPTIPIVTNDLTNELKSHYDTAYANNHTHNNKSVLDSTTASYTSEEKNKLSGIAAGAQVNEVSKQYVDDLIAALDARISALENP